MAVIYDIEGNAYNTVVIGEQEWIVENLRTTKYKDGTSIPNITDNDLWIADTDGAYCWYDNDEVTHKDVYGALYNWYAVNNAHGLCYFTRNGVQDTGWRIPIYEDILVLEEYLGGQSIAGGKMKETGTEHWKSPNTGATNSSGFTGLPGGSRSIYGTFVSLEEFGLFCLADGYIYLDYFSDNLSRGDTIPYPELGKSVRCVRDSLKRGITISHNLPSRVTSTDIVPSVTFVVIPAVDSCFEFVDMYISSSYKPYTVELAVDKDFTDSVIISQSKIITYNDGWYHIKRLPRTDGGKVLIGGALYIKVNFEDNTKFYDLKFVKTGYREIIGG